LRPLAALAALACTLLASGCAGVKAADLFIVQRTGSTPHARLTLLVNEEGAVHCNGTPAPKLSDSQLVRARAIQEDLRQPAASGLSLPASAGSVFSYVVRDPDGSVRFAENSPRQPAVLHELALFVLSTAQHVCGLPE
jgi:hypothetical protein